LEDFEGKLKRKGLLATDAPAAPDTGASTEVTELKGAILAMIAGGGPNGGSGGTGMSGSITISIPGGTFTGSWKIGNPSPPVGPPATPPAPPSPPATPPSPPATPPSPPASPQP
jgi:hypothetical protein